MSTIKNFLLLSIFIAVSACAPAEPQWGSELACEGKCENQAQATTTKFPVYFAHGFKATGEGWDGLRRKLEAQNPAWKSWAFADSVDLAAPVSKRSRDLRRDLERGLAEVEQNPLPAGEAFWRINIIAHSMGGLDSRYLINNVKYNNALCHTLEQCEDLDCDSQESCEPVPCCTDEQGQPEPCCDSIDGETIFWRQRIASVTTLSTPHHGSSFADVGYDWITASTKKNNLTTALLAETIALVFSPDLPHKPRWQLLDDSVNTARNLSMKFSRDVMTNYREPDKHRVYSWGCALGDPAACESYPPTCDFPEQWEIRIKEKECALGIQAACEYLEERKEGDKSGCQVTKVYSSPWDEDLPQRRTLAKCAGLPEFADGNFTAKQAQLVAECYKLPAPKPGLPPIFSWAGATCPAGPFGGSTPFIESKLCSDLLNPVMTATYRIIRDVEGFCAEDKPCYAYNDGIVSVNSASYGIFMGVKPADHFNWTTMDGLFSYIYAGFVAPPEHFYFNWLDRLAEAGY